MSKLNGDKARFNRIRKANSRRRKRTRELRQQLTKGTVDKPGIKGHSTNSR